MSFNKSVLLVYLTLVAIITLSYGQNPQGDPQENQAADQYDEDGRNALPVWTTCDFTAASKISCLDCSTRLICKPVGGLVKQCGNPYRPYCNNGICSSVPSAECVLSHNYVETSYE